ncbi:PQQ-binding-like beta-propeller repeat protein, partial [Candidatus Sumerlaeota bacterium]|nr:PQQ-binding-like beta-propeller repeat protein [Candidatus Sumerlaeota bacterium]
MIGFKFGSWGGPAAFLAFLLGAVLAEPARAQYGTRGEEWPSYGGDAGSTKYSPLDQINKENFESLRVVWTWQSPDDRIMRENRGVARLRISGFKATPLMIGGVLYLNTGLDQVAALDALTGDLLWIHDPESYKGGAPASAVGFLNRGVTYWSDGEDQRIFHGTSDGYLMAFNARTGKPIPDFGVGGKVDLMSAVPRVSRQDTLVLAGGEAFHLSVDSPPTVCRDVVIVGSSQSDRPPTKEWPPGYVQAFDVRTGEPRWVFHAIPEEGEFGTETWENDSWRYSGDANVWSMMSVDEELGYVYLPTT